jgi:hypothetical protein
MIEKLSTTVKFLAFFTSQKAGKTGLTVTVNVRNPAGTLIVEAGAATEVGDGLYSYVLSSNNSTAGEYVAVFKTSDSSVDLQWVPSLWSLGRAGVDNLDDSVSSVSGAVWDTATTAMTASGSIGARLKSASTVSTTGAQLAAALS